jgi:aldose 1-epimerase
VGRKLSAREGRALKATYASKIFNSNGVFHFRGQRYEVNPNRHGFVRDKRWTVAGTGASDEEGAWLTSSIEANEYPEEILRQFPFPFRLTVTYCLKDSALDMDTEVRNTGEQDMPMGFGIHPYFRRPAQKRWELVDSLPTGNLLEMEGHYVRRSGHDG